MSKVVIVKGRDAKKMIEKGLNRLKIVPSRKIVLKPNLIDNRPYPVTTPLDTIEGLIEYFKFGNIFVAEGSGWCPTPKAFQGLGYFKLEEKYGINLIDLNNDKYKVVEDPNAMVLKKFEFPITLEKSYLVSVPVLKVHSITGVTLSVKNMLGATIGGKGKFHTLGIDECIVDVNIYTKPKLAVIDGRIACIGGELGGPSKEFGVMIFSQDLVAADVVGARVLGRDPSSIMHLRLASQKGLGTSKLEEIEIEEI
jgi:uncharacterized protein (DUF362 family)